MWIVTPDMLAALRLREAEDAAEPEAPCPGHAAASLAAMRYAQEPSAPAGGGAASAEPALGADGDASLRQRLAWAVLHMLEEFEAEGIEPPDSTLQFLRDAESWDRVAPPVDRMLTTRARARRNRAAHLPKRHGAFLAPDEAPRGPPRMLNVLA